MNIGIDILSISRLFVFKQIIYIYLLLFCICSSGDDEIYQQALQNLEAVTI